MKLTNKSLQSPSFQVCHDSYILWFGKLFLLGNLRSRTSAWGSRNKKATYKHLGIRPLCSQVALNQLESGSRIVS
jgi:hypothetical protein